MAFPRHPPTTDAKRSELLRLFAVDEYPNVEYPNVFILGSHARYVTVYGQQVRALNLVSALAKSGYISKYTRVGIVGGGIAGLTAAAAAATAGAGRVQVFESEPSLMRLQRNSEKRFIHPRIYDWPDPDVRTTAELPIMSWKAKVASEVAKDLLDQLENLRKKAGDHFPPPLLGCRTFELKSGPNPTLVVNGEVYEFDVLILAVGFGRDDTPWTHGYWTDDDLGATELEQAPRTWLISGSGDGALTDLMRLCILDFTHQAVLEAVDDVTRDRVGARLFAAEKAEEPEAGVRTKAFLDAAKEVDADLRARLQFRNIGTVYLNCDPTTLFERGSSVLNRLITAWLLVNDRFQPIAGGHMSDPVKAGNQLRVEFEKREPLEVDRVVIRHGPKTPYEKQAWLQPLGRATSAKRDDWKAIRQFDDWTRTPMYDDELPFAELSKALRIDFGSRIGCVIVTGANELEGRPIESRVEDVLERLTNLKATERYAPGREIEKTPVVLSMKELLSSPAMYERGVRAMCTAEIAIFDLTDYESAVMLLLGIRSAVRRGVTVAVTAKPGGRAPFNVGSLNPVPFDKRYVDNQTAALERAFETLVAIPYDYLDLPAYDAVRTLGDDYRKREPKEEILVLRWFDEDYSRLVGDEVIRSRLETQWPNTTVLTTLDSRSPQLVEQRLYAAMRRDLLCIADWTAARPNVFFELGVRLAVSEHDPISVLCTDPPPTKDLESAWPKEDSWLPALEAMFGVTKFSMKENKALRQRIENYDAPTNGTLSRGRTYAVITEMIDAAREPGGEPVEMWLLRTAGQLSGPPVEDGMVPVLYSKRLKPQVRQAAVERMLAAWYYLAGRHRILERMRTKEIAPDHPFLKTMLDVGTKFSAQVRESGEEFQAVAKEVRQALLQISAYMKGKQDGGRHQ